MSADPVAAFLAVALGAADLFSRPPAPVADAEPKEEVTPELPQQRLAG